MSDRWTIEYAAQARRALGRNLPAGVTWAAGAFIHERLADNPYRIGKPLHAPHEGVHAAHLGPYRVFYVIEEDTHTIKIVDVIFRADAYRRRG